jgi:hypothetical protein
MTALNIATPFAVPPPNLAHSRGYEVVRTFLGLVLIVASAAKGYEFATGSVGDFSSLGFPGVQIGTAIVEALFGLWLLGGRQPHLTRIVAIIFFSILFSVAAYQGLSGKESCACFGQVPIRPWYAAVFDLGALLALFTCRPTPGAVRYGIIFYLPYVVGCLAIGSCFAIWAHYQFGSVPAAIAFLRGDSVAVIPSWVDGGDGPMGSVGTVSIELANLTDHPITILGWQSNSRCVVTKDLPLTLSGRAIQSMDWKFAFIDRSSTFTRDVVLLTDEQNQPRVSFRLSGRIRPAE